MNDDLSFTTRMWALGLAVIAAAYLHHTVPYLTTMPRVNVDEPWLIERAYQVLHTGRPRQPMLGLTQAYMLQPGYGYLVAPWLGAFGVGMYQARIFAVLLGLGTVLAIAGIGRRLAGPAAGLFAAAYLLSDSNFLGGARMARTDIPAVFFVALAFLLFLVARERQGSGWYAASGASTAAAILCHGNSFWAAIILGAWYLLDHGRRAFTRPHGYAYAAGLLAALAPYLIAVALNRHEVAVQIASFAGDRVPGWKPAFLLQQIRLEPERYRDWYFGLVTDTVRNPLLRVFQLAIVGGLLYVAIAALSSRNDERRRMVFILVWAAGTAAIFAGFINNKALVYMPHLLLGFSIVAGAMTAWASGVIAALGARLAGSRRLTSGAVAFTLLLGHTTAGVAYYEKWYSVTRRTELLPYEATARTIANLVPDGPKYVYAAPQFWIPFAEQAGVEFFSHAAPAPAGHAGHMWPEWASGPRPLFLVLDERQWEPELVSPAGDPRWQQAWVTFIEAQCRLRGYAPGTAYGTLAAYECGRDAKPAARPILLASDTTTYQIGQPILSNGPGELKAWQPHRDPRPEGAASRLDAGAEGVRVSGPKWPGLERTIAVTPGAAYLLTARVRTTSPQDLIYVGRWSPPEVTSLSGGSSGGIVEPAARPPWFPDGHAFIASAPAVRVLFYSEQPDAAFTVENVELATLMPSAK